MIIPVVFLFSMDMNHICAYDTAYAILDMIDTRGVGEHFACLPAHT